MYAFVETWGCMGVQRPVHPDDRPKMKALVDKAPGTRWAWYQCGAMDSVHHGTVIYLAVGPGVTFKEPPKFHPGPNVWHAMSEFKGWVDLDDWICLPAAKTEERGLPKPEAGGLTPSGDTLMLYNADPNCMHDVRPAPGGGVRCTKCHGWFCY